MKRNWDSKGRYGAIFQITALQESRRPAPKAPWPRLLPHFGLGSSACRPEPRLASHLALRAFAAAIPQQLLGRSTHPCAGEMELKPGMSALVTGGASGIGKRRPSSPGPQRLAKRCSVPSPDAPCRFTSTCTKGSIRTNQERLARVHSRTELLFSPLSIRAECGDWGGDALIMRCSSRMEEADVFFLETFGFRSRSSVQLYCCAGHVAAVLHRLCYNNNKLPLPNIVNQ